jgi:signal transduction histidine kinase
VIDTASVRLESTTGVTENASFELPLHWDLVRPAQQGRADLRLVFNVPAQARTETWAILIPRLGNAWRVEINGQLLQEAGEMSTHEDGWAAKQPLWVLVPPSLLQQRNEFRVLLRADRGRRAGLARVTVGPVDQLKAEHQREQWLRVVLPQSASVLSFLVAGFCLLLWWQQRDRLYAAAAVGELAWGLRLADTWWEASPLPWPIWAATLMALFGVWTAANYLLLREVWGGRPKAEQIAVGAVILSGLLAFAVALGRQEPGWLVLWIAVSLLLWLALEARMIWELWRQPSWPRALVVFALMCCTAALMRDVYAARASALQYEESAWSKYAAVSMALAVLMIVSMRFKGARDALVALNSSIQQRIEARERELSVQHQRLTQLERERATIEERSRILRDMHDGAGAHLIAAIHQVESGTASRKELLQTLQESLDQLRLSVDAIHLPAGDVNALLASLRFRLERRIQTAGLRLYWHADELPTLPDWDSTQMRHLQFILLEGISNVIQHAGAGSLKVSGTASGDSIFIDLIDDGQGMGERSGNGRRSMQERAIQIGAVLSIESSDAGTRVRLQFLKHPARGLSSA